MSLTFRWLGAAGIELKAGGQSLAIDPFFTRPTALGFIKPISSNTSLVVENLPKCDTVLVTHSHWDHIMDVPALLQQTGAMAFGSANTCQLLRLFGVGEEQIKEARIGDVYIRGAFKVEVIRGQHSRIPFERVFNGRLNPKLTPPLRLQDYRMDVCLGYNVTVMGTRIVICAAAHQPADVLFAVAQESKQYYLRILKDTNPKTFIPIHWDNFMRPLHQPLRRFVRPGRLPLWVIARLARSTVKGVTVIIPEIFKEYRLQEGGSLDLI